MNRLRRQRPFLESILREANRFKREEMLQHANADQINAVSEMVLNLLKNRIPLSPPITAKLRRYKKVLRELGEITDNALLNKAARIAAESHLLLKDKSVPDGIAVARVKPLARERARLTKRIRQFPMGGVTARRPGEEAEEEEEEELENVGLVTGPVETTLKQLIKGSAKKSPPTVTPKATKKAKTAPAGKPTLAERFKSLEEKLKTRKKPAVRKTEAEKLKPLPGWEDWAKGKKLRRKLEYDEDQEEED
ncbi:hypothetical protein ACROYT_G039476 [Oculina patagonica]